MFAACSSGDDSTPSVTAKPATIGQPPGSVAPNDVCSLVTRQEAAAAIGANVTDRALTQPTPEPVGSGLTANVSGCAYSAQTTGGYVKVELWEAPGQNARILLLTQTICAGKEEVQGLGDFACWYNDSHRELRVAKGGNYLDMSSSVAQGEALKGLLVTALSRLH